MEGKCLAFFRKYNIIKENRKNYKIREGIL